MTSINYIIATHALVYKRREQYGDKYAKYSLRYHLQILDQILTTNSIIKQITIICPNVEDESGEYYTHNDIFINSLSNKGIVIQKMIVENIGISYTQYIKCFMKYNNFDYYLIMEDDWTINKFYMNFDKILFDLYQKTFTNNLGFLNCWSPNKGKFVGTLGGFADLQFHSTITLGLLSNNTFKVFLSQQNINIIDQPLFSEILINNNIPIIDLPQAGLNTRILFWQTLDACIKDFSEDINSCQEPLFVPIQFYYNNFIYWNKITDSTFLVKNKNNNLLNQ